jgi:hypothetical protein
MNDSEDKISLIEITDIDEFADAEFIDRNSINEDVIARIKELDEKKELEPFLREIIKDQNKTPHGPTESADILTTFLHYKNQKVFSAFVLKGKATKPVKRKNTSQQFFDLMEIKNLGLIVLVACWDISDDIQKDFSQTACNIKCNYLIIDNIDIARLFIAYGKICPEEGSFYNDHGICCLNHEKNSCLKKFYIKKIMKKSFYACYCGNTNNLEIVFIDKDGIKYISEFEDSFLLCQTCLNLYKSGTFSYESLLQKKNILYDIIKRLPINLTIKINDTFQKAEKIDKIEKELFAQKEKQNEMRNDILMLKADLFDIRNQYINSNTHLEIYNKTTSSINSMQAGACTGTTIGVINATISTQISEINTFNFKGRASSFINNASYRNNDFAEKSKLFCQNCHCQFEKIDSIYSFQVCPRCGSVIENIF